MGGSLVKLKELAWTPVTANSSPVKGLQDVTHDGKSGEVTRGSSPRRRSLRSAPNKAQHSERVTAGGVTPRQMAAAPSTPSGHRAAPGRKGGKGRGSTGAPASSRTAHEPSPKPKSVGVSPSRGRFRTQIWTSGRNKHLGIFETIPKAEAAHDIAAIVLDLKKEPTFPRETYQGYIEPLKAKAKDMNWDALRAAIKKIVEDQITLPDVAGPDDGTGKPSARPGKRRHDKTGMSVSGRAQRGKRKKMLDGEDS